MGLQVIKLGSGLQRHGSTAISAVNRRRRLRFKKKSALLGEGVTYTLKNTVVLLFCCSKRSKRQLIDFCIHKQVMKKE